jgi:hypothetical protein
MDLPGLIASMNTAGAFTRIVNNPLSRLGEPEFPYLGAEFLPPRPVPENMYKETAIRYRTVIANDAGRFTPVQLKQGVLTGEMYVELGDIDIGSELTSGDYDAVIKLLEQATGSQGTAGGGVARPTMQAMAQVTNWADITLNRPLQHKMEKQRWEAIVNAAVVRTGDDNFSETVNFPNPTGHRPNAGGTWSNDSYDPYTDIMAGAEFLSAKGYTVGRMVTSTTVRSKLSMNAKIMSRVGRLSIQAGIVTGLPGRVTLNVFNEQLSADGLPPVQTYDRQYRTQTSFARFLDNTAFCMFAATGRDERIDLADAEPVVFNDTIGYTAIGRPAGQPGPGLVTVVNAYADKPPRVEGQAWGTTFPVMAEPEGVFVIRSIS